MRLPLAGAQVAAARAGAERRFRCVSCRGAKLAGWDDLRVAAPACLVRPIQPDARPVRRRRAEASGGERYLRAATATSPAFSSWPPTPATRGRGHARRLLTSALKWARQTRRPPALAAGRGRQSRRRSRFTARWASTRSIATTTGSRRRAADGRSRQAPAAGRRLRPGRCRRPRAARAAAEGKTIAGLWEFPGGKVEPGETPGGDADPRAARGAWRRDGGSHAWRRSPSPATATTTSTC